MRDNKENQESTEEETLHVSLFYGDRLEMKGWRNVEGAKKA